MITIYEKSEIVAGICMVNGREMIINSKTRDTFDMVSYLMYQDDINYTDQQNEAMALLRGIWQYNKKSSIVRYALNVINNNRVPYNVLACGMETGDFGLLEWANKNDAKWDENINDLMVEYWDEKIVEWVRNKGYPWDKDACNRFVRANKVYIIHYATRKGYVCDEETLNEAVRSRSNSLLYYLVTHFGIVVNINEAFADNLDAIEYLLGEGAQWERGVSFYIAERGDLSYLMLCRSSGCPMNKHTFFGAAKSGNIEMLDWLESIGCEREDDTIFYAALSDNLECIKWFKDRGDSLSEEVFSNVAETGNMGIIKWLDENNCPYDDRVTCNIARTGNPEALEWLIKRGYSVNEDELCFCIGFSGSFDMITWSKEVITWSHRLVEAISLKNNFDQLKWVINNGCPWSESVITNAEINGNYDMMVWSVNNGCPIPKKIGLESCYHGYTKILRWILDRELESQEFYMEGMDRAIAGGNIGIIKEKILPVGESFFARAAEYGYINLLEWYFYEFDTRDIGESDLDMAASNGNFEVIRWSWNRGLFFYEDSSKMRGDILENVLRIVASRKKTYKMALWLIDRASAFMKDNEVKGSAEIRGILRKFYKLIPENSRVLPLSDLRDRPKCAYVTSTLRQCGIKISIPVFTERNSLCKKHAFIVDQG